MLDDEEAVLGELQNEDECASTEAVENDVAQGAAARSVASIRWSSSRGNDSRRRKSLGDEAAGSKAVAECTRSAGSGQAALQK